VRTRWRLFVALLLTGALLFALVYCGLFDLFLHQTHTTIEAVLGETPRNKLIAYLAAVRRGDREAALACWPANERLGADYEARRQQVTDELLSLGSSLRHRVLEVEWWSGCCEPCTVDDPTIASMARMQVEITDARDRRQQYVFDVVTTKAYWGAAGGSPIRRWVLRDVYPSAERPIAFPWPLPTPTPVPAVTLSGHEGDMSTWQTYQVKAWPLTLRHPPGWSVEEIVPAGQDSSPFLRVRAGGRELAVIRWGGVAEELSQYESREDVHIGPLEAHKYVSRDERGAPRWVVVIPARANDMVSTASYSLFGLPEDEIYAELFDSILASIEFAEATGMLTVEEYPIVAQRVDSPTHLEFLQRIDRAILERRRTWREPSPEKRATGINQALVNFCYRLMPREIQSYAPFYVYDLYCGDTLLQSDLIAVWPVSVSSAGDDFALLVEKLNAPTILVRLEGIEQWNAARHAFIPPVFVDDDLVAVETDDQQRFAVRRGGETIYTFAVSWPRVDNPVKGLWSWMGHWVLEVDGQVLVDGKSLNEELGYDEIFGWQLLGGQPFYFFRMDSRVGISYGGQVLPYQYDEVIHYRCCEPAAFNVAANESMVWFHALRDRIWYYVEMGIYR